MTFFSKEMEEEMKKEIVSTVNFTFQELNSKAGGTKEWMSKKEACKYLSVSNNTFDKFINEYSLKVVIVEGIKRFKKSELDAFYLQHQV